MRIAEYKDGKMIYREMTQQEETKYIKQQKESEKTEKHSDPTEEERLTIIEDAFAELCEVIFNG